MEIDTFCRLKTIKPKDVLQLNKNPLYNPNMSINPKVYNKTIITNGYELDRLSIPMLIMCLGGPKDENVKAFFLHPVVDLDSLIDGDQVLARILLNRPNLALDLIKANKLRTKNKSYIDFISQAGRENNMYLYTEYANKLRKA